MELWVWGVIALVVVCAGGYIYTRIKKRPKEDPGNDIYPMW